MTAAGFLDRIDRLFADRGAAEYHGESVTQLEHALQAAHLAEAVGAPPALVAAALLHDVGHLLHPGGEAAAARGADAGHEELGYRFLARYFGPAVAEPVRLHVPAKRYLCAVEPGYHDLLSPASRRSLELQGGPMTRAEAKAFEREPFAGAAAALRRWDDRAKRVGLVTPPFAHYRRSVEVALVEHPA